MSDIKSLGNLQKSGLKPLRPTGRAGVNQAARTPGASTKPATEKQIFSVETLKNGGSLDLGPALNQNSASQQNPADEADRTQNAPRPLSLRQKSWRKADQPTSRQAQNALLSEEERVEKLGKIHRSAVEYEAVFVDQLVKQMRQSPLAKTPGGETLSGIAEQPFRDFLSQAGGLGLADSIVSQIVRQEGLEQTLHDNPGIMGPNWRPTLAPNMMKNKAGQLKMAQVNQGVSAQ